MARGLLGPKKMAPGSGGRPPEPPAILTDPVKLRVSRGFLLLLLACFTLQVRSPLRLNTDASTLLSMGESAAHGGGFLDDGQKTVFPPGYPALLAILLTLDLAHPWVIVSLNLLFLAAGLLAVYFLLTRSFATDQVAVLMVCSLSLLSWVIVKHATLPLTDTPFFFCSMGSIAIASQTANLHLNWRFAGLAGAAWLLAAMAITLRRVGVALVPPLIFMVVCNSHFKLLLRNTSRATKAIILVAAAVVGVSTMAIIAKTSTLSDFFGATRKTYFSALGLQILSFRLIELGELFDNLPMSKTPTKLHALVPWMGLLLFLLFVFGLARNAWKIGPAEVFMLCYTGILFAWPFHDARFWLPVIPLLIAYSRIALIRLRITKSVITIYCFIFVILGFGALAHSTRITFAGCKFPEEYGNEYLKSTYRAAFPSCADHADYDKVDAKALRLLREYR